LSVSGCRLCQTYHFPAAGLVTGFSTLHRESNFLAVKQKQKQKSENETIGREIYNRISNQRTLHRRRHGPRHNHGESIG
jgi:hypothetical protein